MYAMKLDRENLINNNKLSLRMAQVHFDEFAASKGVAN